MTVLEILLEIVELSKKTGLTFDQMIDWLHKNDKNNLPWEE